MHTIIGQVATGNMFYKRNALIQKFWNKVKAGNNILISAPRRVGKTSLMFHFQENPENGFQVIYTITESINSKNEFFRKLVKEIHTKLSSIQKFSSTLMQVIKSKDIKSIGPDGISFEKREIDFYQEFITLVNLLDLNGDKLLIMVDEYAQTVENIMQDEGQNEAINFLETNRELRITPTINKKIQFVYAGSIGLENIVGYLNVISAINDLYSFNVEPFSLAEAHDYIRQIPLKDNEYEMRDEYIDKILNNLEWNIPYYINIILEEIDEIVHSKGLNELKEEFIEIAFLNAVKKRNYFEHWHTRLRKAFKQDNYNFSKEVLNITAELGCINSNQIIDLAKKYKMEDTHKDVINSLIYDGYINNNVDPKIFYFNSPLLKKWWYNNVAN